MAATALRITELDTALAEAEAQVPGLRPGCEKQILWGGEPGAKTATSLLFIHGFSATGQELRPLPDLCVGANQPYSGQLEGDTLSRHGTRRGLAHVLIEIRHDLIETQAQQGLWARRLAPILERAVEQARAMETCDG